MNPVVLQKITRLVERSKCIVEEGDCERALNEIRKAAETICKILLLYKFDEIEGRRLINGEVNFKGVAQLKQKKLDLNSLIVEVVRSEPDDRIVISSQKDREKVKNYLDAMRAHGNPASHDPDAQKDIVGTHDLEFARSAYFQMLRWMFREHLKKPIPEQLRFLMDAGTIAESPIVQTAIQSFENDLRAWLATVGYEFEALSIRDDENFQFIIKIQERRKELRIFINGFIDEIKMRHFADGESRLKYYDCDEAWLVTSRHVSKSVLDANSENTKGSVSAYNFDELIEQDLNLKNYFEWVKTEIEARGIDKRFTPVGCERVEIDERTQSFLAKDTFSEKEGFTEGYLDTWLADSTKEHVSILGEFGTGKTWLTLHYTWIMIQRYEEARQRRLPRPRIPILVHLRDFAKSVSVDALISDFFFRTHRVELKGVFSAFMQLNRMGKVLLIFDGFDEMSDKVSKQKMIDNFWELASVIDGNSKVILTCRSEHFPQIKEGRSLLRAELTESTRHLTGQSPQFEILQLLMFNKSQIRKMLGHLTSESVVKRILQNTEISDLLRRPIMTELVIDAIKDIESGKRLDMARVYLYAIKRKLTRDIQQTRTFTSLADKVFFMCEVSWWMISNDSLKIHFREFHNLTDSVFGHLLESHEVDYWRYDMRAQTMLTIDDEDGFYRPAHKSFLEFFVAFRSVCSLGIVAHDFMELIRPTSGESEAGAALSYTWREYFNRKDPRNSTISVKAISFFEAEQLPFLAETFGRVPLSLVDLEMMSAMVSVTKSTVSSNLSNILESCRGKSFDDVSYLPGNIVLLLAYSDPNFWAGKDLSRLSLRKLMMPDPRFSKKAGSIQYRDGIFLNFTGTDFSNSDLSDARIYARLPYNHDAGIKGARFDGANLTGFHWANGQLNSLDIDFDKRLLVLGGPSEVQLLDLDTFELKASQKFSGWHVRFSPNGQEVVTSGYGFVNFLDSNDLSLLRQHQISAQLNTKASDSKNAWTGDFLYKRDHTTLIFGCNNSFIYFYDTARNKEIAHLQCFYGNDSISLSSDERYLVAAGFNELILWDLSTMQAVYSEKGKKGNLDSHRAIFHPRRNLFAVANDEGLRFIEAASHEVVGEFSGESYRNIVFSSDGVRVIVTRVKSLEVFECQSDGVRLVSKIDFKDTGTVVDFDRSNIVLAPNDFDLYLISNAKELLHIDLRDQTIYKRYIHYPEVTGASFSNSEGITEGLRQHLKLCGGLFKPEL